MNKFVKEATDKLKNEDGQEIIWGIAGILGIIVIYFILFSTLYEMNQPHPQTVTIYNEAGEVLKTYSGDPLNVEISDGTISFTYNQVCMSYTVTGFTCENGKDYKVVMADDVIKTLDLNADDTSDEDADLKRDDGEDDKENGYEIGKMDTPVFYEGANQNLQK